MMLTSEKLFAALSKVLDLPSNACEVNVRLRAGMPVTVEASWYPSTECDDVVRQLAVYELAPKERPAAVPAMPNADVIGFDAWMAARREAAHLLFMSAPRAALSA